MWSQETKMAWLCWMHVDGCFSIFARFVLQLSCKLFGHLAITSAPHNCMDLLLQYLVFGFLPKLLAEQLKAIYITYNQLDVLTSWNRGLKQACSYLIFKADTGKQIVRQWHCLGWPPADLLPLKGKLRRLSGWVWENTRTMFSTAQQCSIVEMFNIII